MSYVAVSGATQESSRQRIALVWGREVSVRVLVRRWPCGAVAWITQQDLRLVPPWPREKAEDADQAVGRALRAPHALTRGGYPKTWGLPGALRPSLHAAHAPPSWQSRAPRECGAGGKATLRQHLRHPGQARAPRHVSATGRRLALQQPAHRPVQGHE